MRNYLKPKSLNAQIKNTERQIANRQRQVDACAVVLVEKIQQQVQQKLILTPATLLLAGGIGFIIAELSKCPPQRLHSSANKRGAAETSPLKIALNLITSARTLYAALPLFWLMTARYQHQNPEKMPERQVTIPDTDKPLVRPSGTALTEAHPIRQPRKSRYSLN